MSVDISQLTANLDPQRQNAVKSQYEERATSSTAAFLLCFFLGSTGAHRFYLHEWRAAFAHLAVFVVGAGTLIAGLTQTLPLTSTTLAAHPAGLALDVVGVIILLVALIWEIIDLGRIDHQVYQRNLLLAEGIIAGNLLADHTVVDHARQKLDEVTHQAHAAVPALAAGVAGASAAVATEQPGFSTVEYKEVSQFAVSASPEQAQHTSAAISEADWSESETTTETLPAAAEGAAPLTVDETVTRTHHEDGAHVTDSYEVDRVGHPSAAEVAGVGAAGLGAAALGAYEAEQHASVDEPTQPDAAYAAELAAGFAHGGRMSGFAQFDDASDIGDVTDAALPAVVLPAADVATPHARPAYVTLPPVTSPVLEPDAVPEEAAAASEPDAPLYLIPEEPAASYAAEPAQPEEQHAGWGEAAAIAGVAGAGALAADDVAHHEAAPVEEAAPVAEPAAEPVATSDAAPATTPEPVAAPPAAPKMKKIRVRRKVVVDGQVVAEEVVEREVPAEMDTAEAARQIQAELSHATPEQIAKLAHLSPDDEVQLSQRTEGL